MQMLLLAIANIEVVEVRVQHQDTVEVPVQVKRIGVQLHGVVLQGILQVTEVLHTGLRAIELRPTVHLVTEVLEAINLQEAQLQGAVATEVLVEAHEAAEVLEVPHVEVQEAMAEVRAAALGVLAGVLQEGVLQVAEAVAAEETDYFNHFV